MTDEKILQAVDRIEELLPRYMPPLTPKRIDHSVMLDVGGVGGVPVRAHRHLIFMCKEIRHFIINNRREKAFRWLGFLQGAIWALGYTNLEELTEMNRPDPGRGILDVG